jgi:hypothetical protein
MNAPAVSRRFGAAALVIGPLSLVLGALFQVAGEMALTERAACAIMMAACVAIAWPRCLDCRPLSSWFTARTVISSTSSPATVSVVSGRASHQRREDGSGPPVSRVGT